MDQQDTRRRVLIIDDNAMAADLLAEVLTLYGHDAHVAYSGAHGLDCVAKIDPDVVFLDLVMPNMSGFEVAEALRQLPDIRQPLLIAFSAWNDKNAQQLVVDAGFDLHIVKTTELELLLAVVSESPPRDARH